MKEKSFKCPYCLFEFQQHEVTINKIDAYIDEIRCPNLTPDP